MDNSKKWLEEASQLYDRAVQGVLSKCSLLYFTYADFEEVNMNFEKVHKIYQVIFVSCASKLTSFLCLGLPERAGYRPDSLLHSVHEVLSESGGSQGDLQTALVLSNVMFQSARLVFKKAREDDRSNFHVFVAAALMEYYSCKNNNVAFK